MAEYVFDYDGWAAAMSESVGPAWAYGLYRAIAKVMHGRRREEVVRCRDCRFALGTASKRAKTVSCTHFITLDSFENPVPSDVEPDGFCAWGKRRTDGD